MDEITLYGSSLKDLINRSYQCFSNGDFEESEEVLEKALSIDFDDNEVQAALKCSHFWVTRKQRLDLISEPYDSGEYLLKEWRVFKSFLRSFNEVFERCTMSIQRWVFGSALNAYKNIQRNNEELDREILFQIGRCYKGIGDYENALSLIEMASQRKREDPEIIAELADVYALINEMKASKIFFREAFFIDPQGIDLVFLESEMILRLIRRLEDMGMDSSTLPEWIPVYGVVFGVFNVKRELKTLEYGKLRQSIYSLENEVKAGTGNRENQTIPRLLNRYFWLIDHYMITNETRFRIEEILDKIKVLNNSIFEQYIQ
ncbi:MAG: tetratricopeptide repeat protein [Spirochaetales bacterium]|nr:tetratricopeptide repeat protein [Spirochaetales bacterium]